jgi:hypothetical protein
MFNQPQGGSGYFKPADHDGSLILITTVHSIERKFDQMRGEDIDQATVDLVDITADGELTERVFISHKGIVNRLHVGDANILGRIGQVETKTGMKAWVLNSFTDEDVPLATAWVTKSRGGFTPPAEAPAPAAVKAQPVEERPAIDLTQVDPAALAAALAELTK